jgi:hypothetical protein
VGGGVFLRNQILNDAEDRPTAFPFLAHGVVGLDAIEVRGDLDASGAGLYGVGGAALLARNMTIRGDALFGVSDDEAFVAMGLVNLSNSTFEGQLSFAGAQFPFDHRKQAPARLLGQNITVHRQLFIGDGTWTHPATGETRQIAFDCQGVVDFNSSDLKDWLRVPATQAEGGAQSPTIFYFNHATCQVLDDEGGRGWGPNARLVLDGFRYERLRDLDFTTVAGERRAWLARQFRPQPRWWSRLPAWLVPRELAGNSAEYRPQPYEQAVNVLRRSGADAAARDLESCKKSTEMWVGLMRPLPPPDAPGGWLRRLGEFVWRPINFLISWLYRLTFDFGLSARRGFLTFMTFLLVGTVGTTIANGGRFWPFAKLEQPVLTLDTAAVASVAVGAPGEPPRPAIERRDPDAAIGDIPCGRAIVPFIYATDVFIPLLDLRQEGACSVTSEPRGAWWRWAKMLYAILGWVVTSLLILTITGTLRRKGDG